MMINRPEEPKSKIELVFDFYEKNAKNLNRLFKWTGLIIALFIIINLCFWVYNRYVYTTQLKRTTNQISQLIDNVRTTYAVHTQSKTDIMKLMAQSGTVPGFMIRNGKLYNVYGGTIAVSSSLPIEDKKTKKMLPTFKIAYQGLSKDVCAALAQLNWGGDENGLVAAAVGYIDDAGIDTALRDIETDTLGGVKEVTDENGITRKIRQPSYALSTVGKPHDRFNPVPFGKVLAQSGCNCSNRRACSFALRYYTYTSPRKN